MAEARSSCLVRPMLHSPRRSPRELTLDHSASHWGRLPVFGAFGTGTAAVSAADQSLSAAARHIRKRRVGMATPGTKPTFKGQGFQVRSPAHCRRSGLNVGFSIAASVKLFLVTSCHIPFACRSALADVAARGSCFSSRLARDHLMMG